MSTQTWLSSLEAAAEGRTGHPRPGSDPAVLPGPILIADRENNGSSSSTRRDGCSGSSPLPATPSPASASPTTPGAPQRQRRHRRHQELPPAVPVDADRITAARLRHDRPVPLPPATGPLRQSERHVGAQRPGQAPVALRARRRRRPRPAPRSADDPAGSTGVGRGPRRCQRCNRAAISGPSALWSHGNTRPACNPCSPPPSPRVSL